MNVREIVEKYIEQEKIISDDESLVENGVDSLKFIKMIVDLEEEYGVSIEDSDLVAEKFDSINRISKYLKEQCGVL